MLNCELLTELTVIVMDFDCLDVDCDCHTWHSSCTGTSTRTTVVTATKKRIYRRYIPVVLRVPGTVMAVLDIQYRPM